MSDSDVLDDGAMFAEEDSAERSSTVTVEETPEDQHPPDRSDRNGPGLIGRMFQGFWLVVLKLLWPVKKIPGTSAIADSAIVMAYQLKRATSGADAIINEVHSDGVVIPRAGYWDADEQGFVTKQGRVAKLEKEGHKPYAIHGKVPVTWTLPVTKEAFSPVQAAAVKQRDLGRWIELKKQDMSDDLAAWMDGDKDVLLGVRPGRDIILSWERIWEMYFQQIDDEDLQTQYDLGYIAGMEGQNRLWLIVLGSFVAGGIFAGIIVAVFLWLSGGGGGGAGIIAAVAPLAGVI